MIKAYNNFFLVWYIALKSIERGYVNQTNSARVFNVAMVISFLELLNVMTVFQGLERGNIFFVGIALTAVNTILFYQGSRYEKIIKNYPLPGSSIKVFVFIYSVTSIILFVIFKVL